MKKLLLISVLILLTGCTGQNQSEIDDLQSEIYYLDSEITEIKDKLDDMNDRIESNEDMVSNIDYWMYENFDI